MGDKRRRVLIAEDEFLIAMDLKAMLDRLAFESDVVGSLDEGLIAAREREYTAAIVDYDLHGRTTEPLVAALEARGIPFVIASGMRPEDVKLLQRERMLEKPYTFEGVQFALQELIPS